MSIWQLQDAKARFSDLVRRAESEGPQEITLHGRPVAVLVSRAEFERLSQRRSLTEFMQASPLYGLDEIDLERDQSLTRPVSI